MIYPQNFEQKIGFDEIRNLIKERCLSTLGKGKADEMKFLVSFGKISEKLDQTCEFARIMEEGNPFPGQYFFDVRPSLSRIKVEGLYLDEQEVFDLRRSLETIRDIVAFLSPDTDTPSPYPNLQELAKDVAVFPRLIQQISRIIDDFGKIRDSASA